MKGPSHQLPPLAALLLILLLPSCTLIHRLERTNASIYLDRTLRDYETAITKAPLKDYPLVLYPVATERSEEGDRLYATAQAYATPEQVEQVALLTGHPEGAIGSTDPQRRMIAAALLGDTVVLRRQLDTTPDLPGAFSLAQLRGDTTQAKSLLRQILSTHNHSNYPREVRRRAAWALTAYEETRPEAVAALRRLDEVGPLETWELLLSDRNLSHEMLRRLTPQLLAETKPGTLLERGLLDTLRGRLWQAHLWPEALDLQRRLPDETHAEILRYEREIELLATSERQQERPEMMRRRESPGKGDSKRSFIDRFGPVRNENNWAMTYGSYHPEARPTDLTPSDYTALHDRITALLVPDAQ